MDASEKSQKKMSPREKVVTVVSTLLFAAIGGVLGVIAYFQNWLG